MDHLAHMQGGEEVTVTLASKALNIGEWGIRYANVVIDEATEEEIADCEPSGYPRRPRGQRAPWTAPVRAWQG